MTIQLINKNGQILNAEVNRNGFPICPHCDNDELWSPYLQKEHEPKPSLETVLRAGLSCYACSSKFQWLENR